MSHVDQQSDSDAFNRSPHHNTKLPCFDFVWNGSDSVRIGSIVDRVRANNHGRPILSTKVKSFRAKSDVDACLFANPMTCPGALHFLERNATIISYGLQTNSTPIAKRGDFEDPTFKFQIPLQIVAEHPSFNWVVNLKEFAHPVVETFSSVGTVGPSFFLAIAMFGFVLQISSLIVEKELKLRQAMSMMGLYDTSYWLSWLTWEGIITLVSSLFTVLFGMMFQLDFFLNNGFEVVFLVFFLFQLNMVVTVFRFPYSDNFSDTYMIIWSFYPPNLLAKALQLLSDATATPTPEDPSISWYRIGKCAPNDNDCLITVFIFSTATDGNIKAWLYDNIGSRVDYDAPCHSPTTMAYSS
ncbi:hypothetical protein L2E82_02790 [Cichorium intybus]|uniref:Uncharacterized protein n=1 Tax=Cichorium intybus TaxID=13427 RepID=A0ACB9H389_CICIN|nr:hypothetical protein L2E82_02790 [Cichorium intybus]